MNFRRDRKSALLLKRFVKTFYENFLGLVTERVLRALSVCGDQFDTR